MVESIVAKVMQGGRVSAAEALALYREAPTHVLGRLADTIRVRKHPEGVVTYIIDRNVNYTNICVARCNFCAFYRPVGSSQGYVLGFEEIFHKIDETIAVGGNQLVKSQPALFAVHLDQIGLIALIAVGETDLQWRVVIQQRSQIGVNLYRSLECLRRLGAFILGERIGHLGLLSGM